MLPIRSSIPHPAESAPFAPVELACPITTSVGLLRYAGAHGGNRPRPRLPWRSIRHGWHFLYFLYNYLDALYKSTIDLMRGV